jgi:hypothetical protein
MIHRPKVISGLEECYLIKEGYRNLGEELKEVKPEELKGLKLEFVAFEGKLQLSKLFDQKIQEEIKKEVGEELMIPLILLSYGKKGFILILYASMEDYKTGKAIITSDKAETVKEFYSSLSKILISSQK